MRWDIISIGVLTALSISSQNHFSTDTDRLGKQYPLQSVDDDKHPVVVFLHFAKVAGSYIQVLLRHWCAATNRSYFESLRPCPFKHCLTLQQMTASQRNEIDVIFGHLPFGIHDLFQLKRPIKYFILLRDPVRQAISAFHYDRFTYHPLAGVFQLQSIARTLNRTFHRQTPFSNQPTESIQLDHARNAVIGHLTGKHHNLEGVRGCLAGYGGSDGWDYAHNNSLAELQAMSTTTLVSFAQRVANQVHKANCTIPTSPKLSVNFEQYLNYNRNLSTSESKKRLLWQFGNNPLSAALCCHHLWFNGTDLLPTREQLGDCPSLRDEKTLRCALKNLKRVELVLSMEHMHLSLRLLEKFLNWTIPEYLQALRLNEAVDVTPPAPAITQRQLILAEKWSRLDRVIYGTGLRKFWTHIHSSGIL